jgi:hypothetical protein
MAEPIFWTNVGVDVQTALSAAQAITAITKATTGVVSYSGADPANGDYVLLTVNGMTELTDRVGRVAAVDTVANTFQLEGEDTSLYNTFSATGSTFQIITFGASFDILMDITASGGEAEMTETTTIHGLARRRAPTVTSPLSFASNALFATSDPGYVECNKAFRAKQKRAIRLRFGTSAKMAFVAYPSAPGVPTGQAQAVVQMRLGFEAQNFVTPWAT